LLEKVVLFFQLNRSIQKNAPFTILIFFRFNQFLGPFVSIDRHIEWEIAKHLLAQMERPIPFGIFRLDFCIVFTFFQTKWVFPLNGKQP
jgi:hypothetical protein